jgi:type IV pilus assembly protein PilQ
VLLALPALAYRVTDITVEPNGDRTQVTVVADGQIEFEKFLLTDPMRVVLDLKDATHALPATDFAVARGGCSSIRTSQYKAPPDGIVRVIVDVEGELMNYSTSREDNRLILQLQTDPTGIPFTAWSASSQSVEPVRSGGDVPPLSTPPGSTVSGAEVTAAQGVRVSRPAAAPDDGFPVEWRGSGGRRVTIDVVDSDIRTVLRSISDVSGLNIILPEEYEATITARLRNVGWRDALMSILRTQGLVATMEGNNVLRLSERDDFYSEINEAASNRRERQNLQDLQTEVYVIRYSTAEDIRNATESVLSERGQVSIDSRTNSMIVTDIPSKLGEVSRLLPILDSPTAQVMIEAKLVEVDASATAEFGVNWSAGNLNRADALTHGGASVNMATGSPSSSISFGQITNLIDVEATLSFLEEQNQATILSEPRIAIVDNKQGMVLSGQQIPLTMQDESDNTVIQLYDIGVSLTVTPHINADNKVTLELRPEVSDLSGASTADNPIILTQEANTTLMIDDGATAVIGGIMRSTTSETTKRVPILGHIPLIGDALFSYTSESSDQTELVIFVTPHIIRPY